MLYALRCTLYDKPVWVVNAWRTAPNVRRCLCVLTADGLKLMAVFTLVMQNNNCS